MAGVQEKQLRWYNIALMSFITVWGFGNVVNNYANQGLVVVSSWIFIFALYFIPYALIVGQLGSTFKEGKGGVSTGLNIPWGGAGLSCCMDLLGCAYSLSGAKTAGYSDCAGMGAEGRWFVD